jgi:hypothetical protein
MEKIILPDFIVDKRVVEDKLQELDTMIENANRHLQELGNEGIPTGIDTLKDIIKDEDSFKNWLNQAEDSYIGKIGFIPKEERKRIHATFIDLYNRTEVHRSAIQGILFNRHGYNVLQDKGGKFYFNTDEIRIKLEESNRRYFTDKDKEFFDKLQAVYIAFNDLQNFEDKEKYIAFSQTETFRMWMYHGFKAESLLRSWEWGKKSDAYLEMMEE